MLQRKVHSHVFKTKMTWVDAIGRKANCFQGLQIHNAVMLPLLWSMGLRVVPMTSCLLVRKSMHMAHMYI